MLRGDTSLCEVRTGGSKGSSELCFALQMVCLAHTCSRLCCFDLSQLCSFLQHNL